MRKILDSIQRFIRATFFGFTSMLVLLSAGALSPDPDGLQILSLIVVALNFHCFGYVHNDLVDLPIDRTAPLRASDPLVSGAISPGAARVFAWGQIPLSFLVAYPAGFGSAALAILALGYLATIAYNYFGKCCPVPIVTDAVQGVAWISIALVGSLSQGGINSGGVIVAAFGFGFIFLINGVHGGLRDLRNDLARGRVTTAIFFGARPLDDTHVTSPVNLRLFAIVPMLIMTLPVGMSLASGRMPYDDETLVLVATGWAAVTVIGCWSFWQVVRARQRDRKRRRAIYGNAFFMLLGPIVAFTPMLGRDLQLAVLLCFFAPLILFQDRVAEVRALLVSWRSS